MMTLSWMPRARSTSCCSVSTAMLATGSAAGAEPWVGAASSLQAVRKAAKKVIAVTSFSDLRRETIVVESHWCVESKVKKILAAI